MGLTFRDALPSLQLARHLNIALLTPSVIKKLPIDQRDLLLGSDSSLWSGATFNVDGNHVIIYNEKHSRARIESTIMHEIAHILCGHEPIIPIELGEFGLFLRDHNEQHEKEAKWLGGCLQLPRSGLIWALKKGMTIDEIALNYLASVEMTKYRIGVTGARIQVARAKKFS